MTEAAASSIQQNDSELGKYSFFPEGYKPVEWDVICGREKKNCYNHIGNVRFREMVADLVDAYSKAVYKYEKTAIIVEIVAQVRTRGGFVKKHPVSARWYDVGDFLAREKTSQAFRDALHDQYRSSNKAKRERRKIEKQMSWSRNLGESPYESARSGMKFSNQDGGESLSAAVEKSDSYSSNDMTRTNYRQENSDDLLRNTTKLTISSAKERQNGGSSSSRSRSSNLLRFPDRLHQVLQEAGSKQFDDIISWLPTGRAFRIHDKERFKVVVFPQYFQHIAYATFLPHLLNYGFVARLEEQGVYHHPFFVRNRPDLCSQMKWVKTRAKYMAFRSYAFETMRQQELSRTTSALASPLHKTTLQEQLQTPATESISEIPPVLFPPETPRLTATKTITPASIESASSAVPYPTLKSRTNCGEQAMDRPVLVQQHGPCADSFLSQSEVHATQNAGDDDNATPRDITWEEWFQKLEQFKRKNGHCNVPFQTAGGLGYWVMVQRNRHRKGNLHWKQEDQLEELGFWR